MLLRYFMTGFFLWALAAAPGHAQRTFTNKDGKRLEGEIVAASDASVTLSRRIDGREFVIPLANLTDEDRKFIAGWLADNTRPGREIELNLKKGGARTMIIPKGVYLEKDGSLTLYPGDTVHLEFEGARPRVVSEITDPERTVTFSMSHDPAVAVLTRKTRIRKTVAMDCAHRNIDEEEFHPTDLPPVKDGLTAYDVWPETVWTLRLNNFRITDP
jgi:hypothetical protein